MKKLGIAALLLTISVVILSVAGCSDDKNRVEAVENNSTEGVGKTTSYLFVQNAASGTFTSNGDETYTLTMNGVSSQTIYFSDRPKRDAGQIDMQTYLNSGCFDNANPPNAAIDVLNGEEGSDVVIVELLDPVYNSDTATLQYTVRILEDANHSVASLNERNDASIPASFGAVAVFIDDCSDVTVGCGDWAGAEAGTVRCCQCWHVVGCDFKPDCCSFERCQNKCISEYTIGSRYLQAGDGTWVESYDSWEVHNTGHPY